MLLNTLAHDMFLKRDIGSALTKCKVSKLSMSHEENKRSSTCWTSLVVSFENMFSLW